MLRFPYSRVTFQFTGDQSINPVLFCQDCIAEVDEAFAFREKILKAEDEHFSPLLERSWADAENDLSFNQSKGFEVCRVCLFSSDDVLTKTIFKNYGKNGMELVEMIFHFTDFNVSFGLQQIDWLMITFLILDHNRLSAP
jgi:hypothetical protein